MRKSDLHPSLRESAVPVPGHSGCYAVVPPPAPSTLPANSPLLPLAQREIQILSDAVEAAPDYAHLLMHMLNRRDAVDSSQIEGTHTQFDELLLQYIEKGTPDAVSDSDAEQTLNYVRAYTLGAAQVRMRGQCALDSALIRAMHGLMSGSPRASPGQFRDVQNFIGGLKMEQARFIPPPPAEVPRLMTDLDRLIHYQPDPESHYDVSTRRRRHSISLNPPRVRTTGNRCGFLARCTLSSHRSVHFNTSRTEIGWRHSIPGSESMPLHCASQPDGSEMP